MPECESSRRLKQALHEVQIAIGAGRIDLPKLKTILTTEHEECE